MLSNHLIFCPLLLLLPQSFPVPKSFPMSRLFTSGGQSIGTSASASVLPMNIQGGFPLGLTDLISLLSKRLSRIFPSTTIQRHQFFGAQPSLRFNSHMTTGKTIALTLLLLAMWCLCFLICQGRGTRDPIDNIHWIIEKAREFQKNIYFCFFDYTETFVVDHNKLWKTLQEMGIPDHLAFLLRNLYAGQEAAVRKGHGTMTGSKLGKEYIKAVYCNPAYLTYMQNT